MKVKQSTAGIWTTDKHVNRRGCPVEWSAYDVRMSGNGPVLFDIQAQVLNAHTVNATASYTKSSSAGSGTARYTYDANGNRTEKWTNGLFAARHFYDHDSQLQGISFNNDSNYTDAGDYEYVYDPFGRRIKAVEDGVTRYFVYDGLDCVAELDANKNLTKYYTRGLGLGGGIGDIIAEWRPSMTNWYSYNHRGDVTLVTANGGRVTNRMEYTAFGSLSTIDYQLSTRSIGFSSKEFDIKSGLTYYGFRYYDPASGRWMTKDPRVPSSFVALYTAMNSEPVLHLDYRGLFTIGSSCDCFYRTAEDKRALTEKTDNAVTRAKQRLRNVSKSESGGGPSHELLNCIQGWLGNPDSTVQCSADSGNVFGESKVGLRTSMPEDAIKVYPRSISRADVDAGDVIFHEAAHACSWRHGSKAEPGGNVLTADKILQSDRSAVHPFVPGPLGTM